MSYRSSKQSYLFGKQLHADGATTEHVATGNDGTDHANEGRMEREGVLYNQRKTYQHQHCKQNPASSCLKCDVQFDTIFTLFVSQELEVGVEGTIGIKSENKRFDAEFKICAALSSDDEKISLLLQLHGPFVKAVID